MRAEKIFRCNFGAFSVHTPRARIFLIHSFHLQGMDIPFPFTRREHGYFRLSFRLRDTDIPGLFPTHTSKRYRNFRPFDPNTKASPPPPLIVTRSKFKVCDYCKFERYHQPISSRCRTRRPTTSRIRRSNLRWHYHWSKTRIRYYSDPRNLITHVRKSLSFAEEQLQWQQNSKTRRNQNRTYSSHPPIRRHPRTKPVHNINSNS